MSQAAPVEQIRYLRGLLVKAQKAEFVDEAKVAEYEEQIRKAEEAVEKIMELMKDVQGLYTEVQPQVLETIHQGALKKNGRGDG